MNTIEQSASPDLTQDQSAFPEAPEKFEIPELKISGFDGGTRSVLKEPSLYLSIAIIFIATSFCLGATPAIFWVSFVLMSAVAVMFHVLAERFLFRSKKEFSTFTAPFEGVFVITFGAILPGIGLLAYGAYALFKGVHQNPLEEVWKLGLLLVVPLFNFAVWSAVRRGYLIAPRLIGLMNGLALGLSACWTTIWMKSVFLPQGDLSCKFGWMLLLCTSPFLLFAAGCLCLDLWQKTEANISSITMTFAVLGVMLSLLLVFAPMARAFFLQSLITDAQQNIYERSAKAISLLRALATDEDLQPSKHPVSGLALAALLIPNRGLNAASNADRDLYFKITGKSYLDSESTKNHAAETEQLAENPLVGSKIPGLSLSKSQISGSIDTSTLSSSIDWTLAFHNSSGAAQEARAEINLPPHAVVSQATLWIDGEARSGAVAPTTKVQQAYQSEVNQQRDPLLVTMSAPNRILVQCFPVQANSDMKVKLGFKIPLETTDGQNCSIELPKFMDTNFAQARRTRVNLLSQDLPVGNIPDIATKQNGKVYSLTGIIKSTDGSTSPIGSLAFHRSAPLMEFATPDWYLQGRRFIVQRLAPVTTRAPKRVFVVLDTSASLKSDALQIKEALTNIPAGLKPTVYISVEQDPETTKKTEITANPLNQAQKTIKPETFVGGQDNAPVLREALEVAAEEQDSAVLWIHGPQPLTQNLSESTALDLVHNVRLYDVQIESGPNSALQAIKRDNASNQIAVETVSHITVAKDLKTILSGWQKGATEGLSLQRTLSATRPQMTVVTDRLESAQLNCLWANEEVTRLLARDQGQQAQELAAKYQLVSPVTGAVVLANHRSYRGNHIDPDVVKEFRGGYSRSPGLVGAPVDPRYGQSNMVGQLADFGYDTARDIMRLVTAASFILSISVAAAYLKGRKSTSRSSAVKAVALVLGTPFVVNMLGTFMINNFGGLGGGL